MKRTPWITALACAATVSTLAGCGEPDDTARAPAPTVTDPIERTDHEAALRETELKDEVRLIEGLALEQRQRHELELDLLRAQHATAISSYKREIEDLKEALADGSQP